MQNSLGTINLVLASGRIGKPKSGYGTIVGQANGQGGREHGQKCDQLPGWRDISNPEHRQYIAGVWGIDERELPGPASTPTRCSARSTPARSRACSSICFNPKVSLPDNAFVTRCLEKLEFYVAIDFFLNDTARHADIVLPGSLHEEDEGTVTQVEGRIIKINKAVDCPGEAREDWRIIQDIARALGRPHGFTFGNPREIFEELRVASKGGVADYSGVTYEKIERQMGVFWPCYSEDPRTGAPTPTIRARRGCSSPAATTRSPKARGRSTFPTAGPASTSPTTAPPVDDASDGVPDLPDDRPRREPVPVGHADAPHRPAGEAVPRAAHRDAPAAGREARHRRRRLGDGRDPARRDHAASAMVVTTIRPDTIFIPYHWAGPEERQPADRGRAGSDQQDSRSTRCAGAACARPRGRPTTPPCSSRSNRARR